MAEPMTALHLLPEDAYPFSLAFFWLEGRELHVEWSVTFLSPKGANPMELASVKVPPVRQWCGHEVDVVLTTPEGFFDSLLAIMHGEPPEAIVARACEL